MAVGQSGLTTDEDTAKLITLSAIDVDSTSLTFSIGTGPSNGSLSAISAPVCTAVPNGTGTPGTTCTADVTYTPAPNFNGPDSFTFTVNDGSLPSAPATVSLTVTAANDAPVAASQGGVTTDEDTPKGITLSASDADNTSVTFTIVSPPAKGTLSAVVPAPCTPDGTGGATCTATVTYTPALNFNGNDSFTFKANDGAVDSNVATVSIAVNTVNDKPVANDQTVITGEDTPAPITLSGTDVDGNNLTFAIASGPSHGTLGPLGAPSCTTDVNGVSTCTAAVTYTPAADFNGPDTFTFTVSDGSLTSDAGTVGITVTAASDAPVAADQSVTATKNTDRLITLSATDGDGDSLTFSILTGPTIGSLSAIVPVSCTTDVNGVSTCTADVTYTPATDTTGPDSFTFKASDATQDSNVATVSINVTEATTAPTITSANATTFTVGVAGTFTVTTTGTPTVATITRGGVALPGGVSSVDNGNGTATLSGTPAAGTGGTYVFSFTASNGVAPDAVQNPFTLTINQALAITSANATTFTVGLPGGPFTVTTTGFPTVATITRGGVALPGGVSYVDNGNGTATLSGTPAAGTGGTYVFSFTASNGVAPDAVQNPFTLTINQALAITSANAATFAPGKTGQTFSVTTTGFPTNTISRTGTLPSGVTFTDNLNNTATIAGTPAAGTQTGSPYAWVIRRPTGSRRTPSRTSRSTSSARPSPSVVPSRR